MVQETVNDRDTGEEQTLHLFVVVALTTVLGVASNLSELLHVFRLGGSDDRAVSRGVGHSRE